ncbi:MAG: hypothetical protein H7287_08480 [Thermoleophilia bacterium]|nr:hypothetical protein [Thermoleophilia bacterium]
MTTGDITSATRQPRALQQWLLGSLGTFLVLLMLPVCIALDVPLAGWAIGAVAVLLNRVIQQTVAYFVRDASLTVVLGAMGFSTVFRALFTALALFFVGAQIGAKGDRPIGFDRPDLARVAVVVFIIGFTVDAAIETIRRAADRERLAVADAPTSVTPPQEHLA